MVHEKKTLLITGGSGFIGKNIIEHFQNNLTIFAPTHNELDLLSFEKVTDFFKETEIDYVIHCANIGGTRKELGENVVEKNTRMFINLAENRSRFDKMIYFGSGAEYNKQRPLQKITETHIGESIPTDDYGFSKYIMNKLTTKTENITNLRLFGVFGKYEDYEYKFISNAIVKSLLVLPITIQQNVYFDWLYIDDLMRIVQHFINYDSAYTVYNTTPNSRIDLVGVVEMINSCSPIKSKTIIEHQGLNHEYSGSNARLLTELGSFEFTPLSKSIPELTDYYRTILPDINFEAIRKDVYAERCNIKS
jgi:UDP-glucose 4-epimerase